MNEDSLGRRLRPWLDRGTARLDPEVARGLGSARHQALAAMRAGRGPGPLEGVVLALGERLPLRRLAVPLLAAAIALAGIAAWTTWTAAGEIGEVELLEDELPLDALTDGGFDRWLEDTSAR
ncbi:MAG: DUF3619 family protein [Burkholderiales bacterium]|jgi:hypothetical protein|nr:DUF3619 family protein [Burkholderiales bacterium]